MSPDGVSPANLPADDLVQHAPHAECVCGPTTVPIVAGDGSEYVVVVHHRIDGRVDDWTRERNPR